ncbi:hypothetical protein [Kitasatospora griseola]|uniref:hypothetical protein n=1 Tax=Kitasatospora griseola TaxID=2064 RepID=UPI0006960013|nr:hypothetical protein [Kitasatospora griseola]
MIEHFVSTLEVVVPVLIFITAAGAKWKAGITDTWRDEAEAQRQRAERLHEEVADLYREVKALRAENAELRKLLGLGEHLGTFLGGKEIPGEPV